MASPLLSSGRETEPDSDSSSAPAEGLGLDRDSSPRDKTRPPHAQAGPWTRAAGSETESDGYGDGGNGQSAESYLAGLQKASSLLKSALNSDLRAGGVGVSLREFAEAAKRALPAASARIDEALSVWTPTSSAKCKKKLADLNADLEGEVRSKSTFVPTSTSKCASASNRSPPPLLSPFLRSC